MVVRKGVPKLEQLTRKQYHSIARVLVRHMVLHGVRAGELLGAVWAGIPQFEVFLVDVSHQALFLQLSSATNPVAPDLCLVWTSDAVMGAQMIGKLGALNK